VKNGIETGPKSRKKIGKKRHLKIFSIIEKVRKSLS
jgi:hypothetical protein